MAAFGWGPGLSKLSPGSLPPGCVRPQRRQAGVLVLAVPQLPADHGEAFPLSVPPFPHLHNKLSPEWAEGKMGPEPQTFLGPWAREG